MTDRARRGVVLVTVLWTIILLSTLAMATSLTFRAFTGIMAADQDRLKADGLLTAGLEVGAGLTSSAGERPLLDVQSTVRLASGAVRVRLDDEGGRIDVGKAQAPLLAALFQAIRAPQPDMIAQSILEWRKANAAPAGNPAPSPGAANPPAASPANPPPASPANPPQASPGGGAPALAMGSLTELLQVPQMRPEWVRAIAPYSTVFGNETVNPLTASPAVLGMVPGIDRARIPAFVDARRLSMDQKQLAAMLGPTQTYLKTQPAQAVAVNLTVELTDGYAAAAEAVIVCLLGDRQPYRVLAWNPLPTPQDR